MNDQIIPARTKKRELLDSVFLYNYARRIEFASRWTTSLYAVAGAVIGYGMAWAYVALETLIMGFRPFPFVLPLPPQAEVIQAQFPIITIILPLIFAVIAVFWGKSKSDNARFKSQLALH
ncbi:MAG: hypothetical protein DI585_07170, partial [Pseudomonas fluorescens]